MSVMYGEKSVIKWNGSAIGQVLSIDISGYGIETVETTNLDSTARTHRGVALPEGGEISTDVQFDNSEHSTLTTAMEAGTDGTVAVGFWSDGTAADSTKTFPAIVTGFEWSGMSEGENVTASVTFKATDKPS